MSANLRRACACGRGRQLLLLTATDAAAGDGQGREPGPPRARGGQQSAAVGRAVRARLLPHGVGSARHGTVQRQGTDILVLQKRQRKNKNPQKSKFVTSRHRTTGTNFFS